MFHVILKNNEDIKKIQERSREVGLGTFFETITGHYINIEDHIKKRISPLWQRDGKAQEIVEIKCLPSAIIIDEVCISYDGDGVFKLRGSGKIDEDIEVEFVFFFSVFHDIYCSLDKRLLEANIVYLILFNAKKIRVSDIFTFPCRKP